MALARTAALNKKGLRPDLEAGKSRVASARTAALNKKGLRPSARHILAPCCRENRSPEQEGITTRDFWHVFLSKVARTAALNKKGLRPA